MAQKISNPYDVTQPFNALENETFAIGTQDATTWPSFHVFTSNQTANTILLTIAAVLLTPSDILPSAVARSEPGNVFARRHALSAGCQ